MPEVIKIEHPDLDDYVEVNDDTLPDWEAVGWTQVVAKNARAASAPSRKKHAAPTTVEGADNG